ncbi:MAG: divergent polysaccharide deacetylase family protein [Candidatus Omnitrophota bacterium]
MTKRIKLWIAIVSGILLILLAAFYIKEKMYKPKPMIALVIDDWGYNLNNLPALYSIKRPITLAILPNLKYSTKIAQEAKEKRYETILHLPLESKGNRNPELLTIRCNMEDKEIIKKFDSAFQGVPGITGVNNHQGSKATENSSVMRVVLGQIKNKNLFFLDSVTSGKSVCKKVSEAMDLRYVERDVFLDLPLSAYDKKNISDYIRKQLYKLAEISLKKGYAIGIGHDRKETLKVLKEVSPELEKLGLRFARVSDIIKYKKKCMSQK